MKPHTLLLVASLSAATAAFAQNSAPNVTAPETTPNGVVASNPATDVSPHTKRAPIRVPGQILPAPDLTDPAANTIAGRLDTSRVANTIESQSTDTRAQLFKELRQRINDTDQRISQLNPDGAGSRASFDKAMSDYRSAKQKLLSNLDNSQGTEEKQWELQRSGLAADYSFFASAAGGVEISATP